MIIELSMVYEQLREVFFFYFLFFNNIMKKIYKGFIIYFLIQMLSTLTCILK